MKAEIFDRQVRLFKELTNSSDGTVYQEKIENSHVVVMGLGGLGSNVAVGLAQSGVKKITVVDFDIVEPSNINRTVGYSLNSVGIKKTKALSDYIFSNYPWCKINVIDARILSRIDFLKILKEIEKVDLVVNCIDRPHKAKYFISDICVERNIPFIKGGYSGYFGGIGPFFIPEISVCQRCFDSYFFSEESNTEKELNNHPSASSPWITQTLSSLMVRDIIGFLSCAYPVVTSHKYLQIDFLNIIFHKIDVKTKSSCKYGCVSSIAISEFRPPFSKGFVNRLKEG